MTPEPEEESRVTGRGRLHYRHTDLGQPTLELDGQLGLHVQFSFVDVEGRTIRAHIREGRPRDTRGMNLLAPVGLSSARPQYFPLFLLHDFDFVRLGETSLDVTIDGRAIKLAPFPVPLPVQGHGAFIMDSAPAMGRISGSFRTAIEGDTTRLALNFTDVSLPRQRGLLYRLIVNRRSVFARWPKAYRYDATINRSTGHITATWTNQNQTR